MRDWKILKYSWETYLLVLQLTISPNLNQSFSKQMELKPTLSPSSPLEPTFSHQNNFIQPVFPPVQLHSAFYHTHVTSAIFPINITSQRLVSRVTRMGLSEVYNNYTCKHEPQIPEARGGTTQSSFSNLKTCCSILAKRSIIHRTSGTLKLSFAQLIVWREKRSYEAAQILMSSSCCNFLIISKPGHFFQVLQLLGLQDHSAGCNCARYTFFWAAAGA